MRKILSTFLLLFFFTILSLNAQVKTKTDSLHYIIGDWINLHFELTIPANAGVKFPSFDTLPPFTIIGLSKTDTIPKEDSITLKKTLTLSVYDSGNYVIPAFDFIVFTGNKTTKLLSTKIYLNVTTLPVDTTKAIKPIHAPLEIPMTFREMLPYIIGGILLIVMLFYLYKWYKKRKNRPIPPVIIPGMSAREIALAKIAELTGKKLLEKGMIKSHYTELVIILKEFIEQEHSFSTFEMTSSELLSHLKEKVAASAYMLLADILNTADMVKFAQGSPASETNSALLEKSTQFINSAQRNV